MKQSKPEIYSYHDFRGFLNDHLEYLKNVEVGFNTASLARRSGISKAYFSMVLAGKRKLTEKALLKILPHLYLSHTEQSFFRLLCLWDQAENQDEKTNILDQIQKLRGYQNSNPKEMIVYRYLSHWYYVAIREMANIPGFKLEAEWIYKRLGKSVPRSEIEKAVKFLLENNFLATDAKGKIYQPEKQLDCMDQIYKTSLGHYYKQTYSRALDRLPQLEAPEKHLTAHMESISAESFAQIKKLFEDTFKKVVEICQKDKGGDAVYQFSLLGFPVSTIKREQND